MSSVDENISLPSCPDSRRQNEKKNILENTDSKYPNVHISLNIILHAWVSKLRANAV